MAHRRRLAIGIVAAAVLAGCSSGGTSSQTNADAGYAVFSGNLHLAGEIRVDGRFTDAITGRGESCAQYAQAQVAATTLWVTPTPNNAQTVDGHTVSFTAGVAGSATTFDGPGVYVQPAAQVDVLLVDNSSFLPGEHPTTTITVTSSGSGSMVFDEMVDGDTGRVETGEETWTCKSTVTSPTPNVSAGGSPTSRPGGPTPMLTGTLSVSGQFVADGSFTSPAMIEVNGLQAPVAPGTSCATYANGYPTGAGQNGAIGFIPPLAKTLGPPSVSVLVSFPSGYHGPGSYASSATYPILGIATVGVETSTGTTYYVFRSKGGTTSFTVGADGSGTLQFSDWQDTETRGGNRTGTLSGTMAWTCS